MNTIQEPKEAYVVFSGQADLPWLKILKPGFRHCAVLINDGQNWMTIDPLSNYMDVTIHQVPVHFDLPLWMNDRGHTVVPATLERPVEAAPWGVFTCVEAVKRVLGIHDRFLMTPWQLYRRLSGEANLYEANDEPHFQNAALKGDLAWEV